MKTALWFTLFLFSITFSSLSQELNKKMIDEKYDKEILIGYCNRSGLREGEFGESYNNEYDEYVPLKKIVKKIKRHDVDYQIQLVLASWCHDSQEQVPRFYRILDEAGIPEDVMNVICVDGNKTGGEVSVDNYDIVKVPTFIFYRDGKEIGRIIETPEVSLEEDYFAIIR